jgi:hypothetical protein
LFLFDVPNLSYSYEFSVVCVTRSFLSIYPNSTAPVVQKSVSSTGLYAESTLSEIEKIQEKWNTVRHLPKEEAASLEGEWKEAYDRFYSRYDRDMDRMKEIAEKLQGMIEPPRIQKKSNGQRKRDKWAIVQAREAARAAKK